MYIYLFQRNFFFFFVQLNISTLYNISLWKVNEATKKKKKKKVLQNEGRQEEVQKKKQQKSLFIIILKLVGKKTLTHTIGKKKVYI